MKTKHKPHKSMEFNTELYCAYKELCHQLSNGSNNSLKTALNKYIKLARANGLEPSTAIELRKNIQQQISEQKASTRNQQSAPEMSAKSLSDRAM